ncbi:MAG: fibrillarin-like rRNA/tRNA 2'-O-methyltransferase [Candidatus Lokiarchaeota archaeon]|jgi:fibrillarin-like pre-rRNA processing protein|nr:fibrillarin-like rRNA/tRNA 2'-O-methyltransferase [Candidatus Lokiarchaeota archaeon]
MSNIEIRNHPKFYNVFISGPKGKFKLYTRNLDKGNRIYGERLVNSKEIEYREWDPYRSKLAALLLENPITNFLSEDLNCLYLGASSGTTISHLSDIAYSGIIYGVEFAERSIRQLIQSTSRRNNIIPILEDVRYPQNYAKSIFSNIDLIYQDISQPNQAEIAIKNCNYYLKKDGILIFAIKSQSIDSIRKSEDVYAQEKKILEEAGYNIIESVNIHRYAANHIILIVKRGNT